MIGKRTGQNAQVTNTGICSSMSKGKEYFRKYPQFYLLEKVLKITCLKVACILAMFEQSA